MSSPLETFEDSFIDDVLATIEGEPYVQNTHIHLEHLTSLATLAAHEIPTPGYLLDHEPPTHAHLLSQDLLPIHGQLPHEQLLNSYQHLLPTHQERLLTHHLPNEHSNEHLLRHDQLLVPMDRASTPSYPSRDGFEPYSTNSFDTTSPLYENNPQFLSVDHPFFQEMPLQIESKKGICRILGCPRRIRSRGLCKSHGGGRICNENHCSKSAHNGLFCVGHGGGKRCTGFECSNAAQSKGLCKAHGGGARCKATGCTKSSQGRSLCRAHGGGKRCVFKGCDKGAQRGSFCATHGGFRPCKFNPCLRTDRGGGYCEIHRAGRMCSFEDCKKLSKAENLCTMHVRDLRNENKNKL